jgi:signal transduction histidine kinase
MLLQTLLLIAALFIVSLRSVFNNSFIFFGYLNGVCLLWTAVVISWDLFKQYAFQEKRIAQEKLEKEKLATEKEIQKRELIAQQKIELEKQVLERTSELKQSLENLKSTQAQLIQSEKMASLGELTAGIAHEIQNPLNFVNNFSEVNSEMIDELKNELATGNLQLANEIADDIKSNEEKISHHGKRADAIVKSMLEHSRQSSGKKEPTDINALCDEYLRLSYHGLRAKDKNFNAVLKTDLDPVIGKVNIVSQDIGRVLLNLFNNAFYAVSKRQEAQGKEYEPSVSVTTKKSQNSVIITVSDNGNGIPQNIVDKIFQPFFTTKPTGIGTGLGLSLSYDIVKAHGGEIKVESKEEEGTTLIIQLPIIFK